MISIILSHYVGYDNVIIMNKFTILRLVFDFVLTIIACVLLFYLINTKISIVKIFSFILSV